MLYDNADNVYYQSTDLIDVAYKVGIDEWNNLPIINDSLVEEYNKNSLILELPTINTCEIDTRSVSDIDYQNQQTWLMPINYQQIDVLKYCLDKCSSEKEIKRVYYEFGKFESKNMINILRYMIWVIDIMDKENILWGVGRGSSVSSFILYLIGAHCINPLLYNIDCNEFFKEEE